MRSDGFVRITIILYSVTGIVRFVSFLVWMFMLHKAARISRLGATTVYLRYVCHIAGSQQTEEAWSGWWMTAPLSQHIVATNEIVPTGLVRTVPIVVTRRRGGGMFFLL